MTLTFCRPIIWTWSIRLSSVAAATCLLTSVIGCGGGNSDSSATSPTTEKEAAASDRDRCEKKLATAIGRLEPQAMATLTRPDAVVGGLNDWLTTCVPEEKRVAAVSEMNQKLLSSQVLRLAGSARFTESDANYIRDCLLLGDFAGATWEKADAATSAGFASDTDRVIRLFNELVRFVAILPQSEQRVPVGLYEVLVTGRGRSQDRIWIFAEALRQRQIDAVLLETDAPPTEGSSSLPEISQQLVAVIADNKVLLFDPLRGTAVPTAEEAGPIVTKPAGMEALSAGERWKGCRVRLIAQPAAFAPRMNILQAGLHADMAAVLYEELAGGNSEIQPLIERVVGASGGAWTKEQIAIWEYPEMAVISANSLAEDQRQQYRDLMRPFDTPFERDPLKSDSLVNDPGFTEDGQSEEVMMARRIQILEERIQKMTESSEEMFGKPSRRLLKARIEQIAGVADISMLQQLQQVRLASMEESIEVEIKVTDKKIATAEVALPEAIRSVHRGATSDTLYWTSLCQVSRGDTGAAVTTLRNYRRQYPEEKWVYPSMICEAMLLIESNDLAPARELLVQADQEANPERVRVQWLLSRLPAE